MNTLKRWRPCVAAMVCPALFWGFSSTVSAGQREILRSFTRPVHEVQVALGQGGVVAQLHVEEGQRVSMDQKIGELDHRVLDQSFRLAQRRSQSTAKIDAATA
ncbi:MAG: biotin/lipoyl-binding protein, partial [Planctomycetota bacterium]